MSDDLPPLPPVLQADLDAARREMGLPGADPPAALVPPDWATLEADLRWRNLKTALQLWRDPPRIWTSEEAMAAIAALEAENARLWAVATAMLDHLPTCARASGYYALENDCSCGLYERRQVINALLAEPPR